MVDLESFKIQKKIDEAEEKKNRQLRAQEEFERKRRIEIACIPPDSYGLTAEGKLFSVYEYCINLAESVSTRVILM